MVPIKMGRRLPPLVAADLDISINKNMLPRHEYVVENDVTVRFVKSARQRIVE
jgi:hypothetical protein